MAKTNYDAGYIGTVDQWTDDWYAIGQADGAMADATMGYFFPSWSLQLAVSWNLLKAAKAVLHMVSMQSQKARPLVLGRFLDLRKPELRQRYIRWSVHQGYDC